MMIVVELSTILSSNQQTCTAARGWEPDANRRCEAEFSKLLAFGKRGEATFSLTMSKAGRAILSVGDSTLLFQVQGGVQKLLGQGAFVLNSSADGSVMAKVGEVSWPLQKGMPCLRTDDFTYTFAITPPEGSVSFYCVILQKDLLSVDIESLQSALALSTTYSGSAEAAEAAVWSPPNPTWDDGQDAEGGRHLGAGSIGSASAEATGLTGSIKKGGFFLGASLKRAAAAAGASLTAAKAKAEASLTPETKAKIEAARARLDAVGIAAGKAASDAYLDAKAVAGRLVDRASNSDMARSESIRSGKERLSSLYDEMRQTGDNVLTAIMEAAAKVRRKVSRDMDRSASGEDRSGTSSSALGLTPGTVVPAPSVMPAAGAGVMKENEWRPAVGPMPSHGIEGTASATGTATTVATATTATDVTATAGTTAVAPAAPAAAAPVVGSATALQVEKTHVATAASTLAPATRVSPWPIQQSEASLI